MDSRTINDLSLAFGRQEIALWLGPDWTPPSAESDWQEICEVPWLACWAEASNPDLARHLAARAAQQGKLLIEVPDKIDDVLGQYYSIADVLPYFYLKGRGDKRPTGRAAAQEEVRLQKMRQLQRLGGAILVIAGYREAQSFVDTLDRMAVYGPGLSRFLLIGLSNTEIQVLARLGVEDPSLAKLLERVVCVEESLLQVILSVRQAQTGAPAEPAILVGTSSVPLGRLLRREPPVDQDFLIIRRIEVRPPTADEDRHVLLAQLIAGRGEPWRCFAHGLEWPRRHRLLEEVPKALQQITEGKLDVAEFDVPAEPGAGLTTLLKKTAFQCASLGHPTLVHRGGSSFDYDRLRTFLTDLYQDDAVKNSDAHTPAVLVFDANAAAADAAGHLDTFAERLARDGRRAILIRGRSAPRSRSTLVPRHHRKATPRCEFHRLETIAADLGSDQQARLAEWVTTTVASIEGHAISAKALGTIRAWDYRTTVVPLLICLYYILREEFQEVGCMGGLLTRRILEVMPSGASSTATPSDSDRPLSQEELRQLLAGFGTRRRSDEPLSHAQLSALLGLLCSLGAWLSRVSRNVLSEALDLDQQRLIVALVALDRIDMVDQIGPASHDPQPGRLAPSAYYTDTETVGLRHPAYGRMILEWLVSPSGAADRRRLDDGPDGILHQVLTAAEASIVNGRLTEFPLPLLKPVFEQLRPSASHRIFAEDLSVRYLRYQRNRDTADQPGLITWQSRHLDDLLRAFDWLDERLVQDSATLLHSRGITRYKSCTPTMSLDEQETRYEKAILDFDSALALARQAGMENPGNIITSKGLLLLGWAEHEREAGKLQRWQELDTQVEATLREGLATRADNPFAAFGLAKYLLQKVRRMASSADDGRAAVSLSALDNVAQYMAEVLDLLSGEPEAYFRDEWETVRAEAVQLLCKQDMANVIQALQKDRKDLGYALDALRLLEGDIPTEPTIDELEVEQIRAAAGILSAGEQVCGSKVSELGNLLRYATFSADPDRLRLPAYGRRYQLIKRLKDTSSLERPIWLYDYAMLAFQNRDTAEASEAFGRLRRGKRFFEVPRERARVLTKHVDSLEPVPVLVRIVSRDEATGRGWCRLALPFQYRDPIPFSIRTFQSRNASSQIGASPAAHIHIQPAGPYAEPVPR